MDRRRVVHEIDEWDENNLYLFLRQSESVGVWTWMLVKLIRWYKKRVDNHVWCFDVCHAIIYGTNLNLDQLKSCPSPMRNLMTLNLCQFNIIFIKRHSISNLS